MEKDLNPSQSNISELPSPELAFKWPLEAVQEHNWSESAKRWAILRRVYPENPETWIEAAKAHLEAKEFDEAERLLNHSRQYFPNHSDALTQSAALAICKKDFDTADLYLKQARKTFPGHPSTWIASSKYSQEKGDLIEATTYCIQACNCGPNIPAPHIQYAELAMTEKLWEEALMRWKKVREKFPQNSLGYTRAAEAAQQINRPKDAKKLLIAQQYGTEILDSTDSPRSPLPHRKHTSIRNLTELIWTKSIFNLRSEMHNNYLSYAWWILEPLLHMMVYYVVFSFLLQRGDDNFAVFLLTGLIPWMWFMKAVSISGNSILGNQDLMLQVDLPAVFFPLVSILQVSLKELPVFLLLFCFVAIVGRPPDIHWLALIPIILVQVLITAAFSCALAAVIPFIKDIAFLVPSFLTFIMFLSGIFFDYRDISPEWQEIFLLNPIAFLLKSYREVLLDGIMPDFFILLLWGLSSGVICLLLLFIFKKLRYIYPRLLLE